MLLRYVVGNWPLWKIWKENTYIGRSINLIMHPTNLLWVCNSLQWKFVWYIAGHLGTEEFVFKFCTRLATDDVRYSLQPGWIHDARLVFYVLSVCNCFDDVMRALRVHAPRQGFQKYVSYHYCELWKRSIDCISSLSNEIICLLLKIANFVQILETVPFLLPVVGSVLHSLPKCVIETFKYWGFAVMLNLITNVTATWFFNM